MKEGAELNPERITTHAMVYSYSAAETVRNAEQLAEIAKNPEILPWKTEGDRVSLFAIPAGLEQSGEAKATCGFFGINARLLGNPENSLVKPVAIHEGVHLQIAGELRRFITEAHPDITALLHDTIVPDFLAGKITLDYDAHFLDEKSWECMSPGRSANIRDAAEAKEILRVFFGGIKKKLNRVWQDKLLMPAPYLMNDGLEDFEGAPTFDIKDLYEEDPQKIARLVMTGFELGERLIYKLRENESTKAGDELWVVEEIVANYICSVLAGMKAGNFGETTLQDKYKYEKSKSLQDREGSHEQALVAATRVDSYPNLAQFAKDKGIIK